MGLNSKLLSNLSKSWTPKWLNGSYNFNKAVYNADNTSTTYDTGNNHDVEAADQRLIDGLEERQITKNSSSKQFENDEPIFDSSIALKKLTTIKQQNEQKRQSQLAAQRQARLNEYATKAKTYGLNSPEDVKAFQQYVLSFNDGTTLLGTSRDDGIFGDKTQNAWRKYGAGWMGGRQNVDRTRKVQEVTSPASQPTPSANSTPSQNFNEFEYLKRTALANRSKYHTKGATYDMGNGYKYRRSVFGNDQIINPNGEAIDVYLKNGQFAVDRNGVFDLSNTSDIIWGSGNKRESESNPIPADILQSVKTTWNTKGGFRNPGNYNLGNGYTLRIGKYGNYSLVSPDNKSYSLAFGDDGTPKVEKHRGFFGASYYD